MDYSKFTPEYKDSILSKLCTELDPYCLYRISAAEIDDNPELLTHALCNSRSGDLFNNMEAVA